MYYFVWKVHVLVFRVQVVLDVEYLVLIVPGATKYIFYTAIFITISNGKIWQMFSGLLFLLVLMKFQFLKNEISEI
jgi:hypothetical protein